MSLPAATCKKIPRTYSFDKEVIELMNELVGEPKTHGAFLTRLIYVEAARQEERAKRQQERSDEGRRGAV